MLRLIGVEFKILEDILTLQFKRKGETVIAENVGVARAGYDYAGAFQAVRIRAARHRKNWHSSKATRRWRWEERRRACVFTVPIR